MNKSIRIRSVRSLLQSVLLGVALGTSPGVLADASLPVACGGGGCSGRAWVADRSLSSFSRSADGTALLINQAEKRQTFNWESFNVAPGNRVDFKQPGKDAVALNRIFDANPSQIMGNVTATGQIILYNRNGILFGNGAQINVGSLTATTLDVEDDVFNSAGILGAVEQSKAAFVATGPMGSVTVEEGATITTTDAQGRVLIMAPSIENRGTIVTRDGQTVLAASQDKVYLQASGDPALRGILVEVETGGDVSNLGSIIAERGNVTLMGLAVNQQGIVRATTSVRANGSIRLLARDQGSIQASGNRVSLISRHAGDLTLGNNSKTEVLLDETDSSSAIDTQTQLPSTIEGMGKTIHLKSGAAITATSGEVSLVARTNPTDASVADRNTRIYLDEGAKIDVSGATTASLSAQDNLIEVELRSNELRDAPQQRNGPLRNQTIVVDIRKGTPLADISGTLETRQRTLGERMAAGGTINLESQGDVIVKSGTMLDVSGGHISFRPGTIGTTKLISEGRIIDIGEADPGLRYEGIFTAIPLKTFSPGYIEGKDAGQLNILAPGGVVLQGDVKGATSRGVFQRDLPRSLGGRAAFTRSASEMPLGGRLNIDGRLAGATAFGQNPSVLFSSGAGSAAASAVTDALAADMPLVINADWFGERRFNRLSIDSSGRIRLPESVALDMGVGGGIALSGGDVDLLGEITAPAGGIDVSLDGTSVNPVKSLVVGDKAVLDVSGLWVNDLDVPGMVSRQLPVAIAGGTISLDGSGDSTVAGDATLSLGERSIIDVSGGAWLGADRKITAGKGGRIDLSFDASPRLNGSLQGFGLEQGGELAIEAGEITISSAAQTVPTALNLSRVFFDQGGFGSYSLKATQGSLILLSGTTLAPRQQNRVLDTDFLTQPSGNAIENFSHVMTLDALSRAPVNLSFTAAPALSNQIHSTALSIESGTSIDLDPGAVVTLKSSSSLLIDGRIQAPAGSIAATLTRPPDVDPGFFRNQVLWLGPNAHLSASGIARVIRDDIGFRRGRVLPGGTVSLAANRGYLVTSPGSLIESDGAAAVLDRVNGFVRPVTLSENVHAAAGAINFSAAEGMMLEGDFRAQGARATGSSAGQLTVKINPLIRGGSTETGFIIGPSEMILSATRPDVIPVDFIPGQTDVSDSLNGKVYISAQQIEDGRFDRVTLGVSDAGVTGSKLRFDSDMSLQVRQSLQLRTPEIDVDGHAVDLSANYLSVGLAGKPKNQVGKPRTGAGRLGLRAGLVEMVGHTSISGAQDVFVEAQDGIRLRGVTDFSNLKELTGSLQTTANLTLRAPQIFPTTLSQFTIDVQGAGSGILRIENNGPSRPVQSVGGQLTLKAPQIEQAGVIKVPFGQILMSAERQIRLLDGSLTSTSAAGQNLLFGQVERGQDWVYALGSGVSSVNILIDQAPQARVDLDAKSIDVAPGAVVDLSGGGDLLAMEFIPGPGGSLDIAAGDNAAKSFAIVPGLAAAFAPSDALFSTGFSYLPGTQLRVETSLDGLASGDYTVLPARYAFLPGAYLVTSVSGFSQLNAGQASSLLDGTPVVPGKFSIAGTPIIDSQSSGFSIESATRFQARAAYDLFSATRFFADKTRDDTKPRRLPTAAGSLLLAPVEELLIAGSFLTRGADEDAQGAQVDIDGAAIRVALSRAAAESGGEITLTSSELSQLNAGSLLIGGRRNAGDGGVEIVVGAQSVKVDAGAEITGPEVLLVAKSDVTLEAGAALKAQGQSGPVTEDLKISGDSALVRVSVAGQAVIERDGVSGSRGDVILNTGSLLQATGSIAVDATNRTLLDGDLRALGGSLQLGASQISLGNVPTGQSGLILTNSDLAALDAGELLLSSQSSVDFFGAVDLQLKKMVLNSAALRGFGQTGEVAGITADTLTLLNSQTSFSGTAATGVGTLKLAAGNLEIGAGRIAVSGFNLAQLQATDAVTAAGKGGLSFDSDVEITSPVLTTINNADITLATPGRVAIRAAAVPSSPASTRTALGGRLSIEGRSVEHAGVIRLPGGTVELHATGSSDSDDVSLLAGSLIDVSADQPVRFVDDGTDRLAFAVPAGTVRLFSDNGDVDMQAESALDLSSDSLAVEGLDVLPGPAGVLDLRATQGTINMSATLEGPATGGGRLFYDAASISDFSGLIALASDQGFTDAVSIRSRTGDLSLAEQDVLIANDVKLVADNGSLVVDGQINAGGFESARVELWANDDLTVSSTGKIAAITQSADSKGGTVLLASGNGFIDVQSGSRIAVDGAAGESAGEVVLRSTRSETGVNIRGLDTSGISGAQRIDIEAVKHYTAGSIDSALLQTIISDHGDATFAPLANAVTTALGVNGDSRVHMIAGIEIQNPGDISLNTPWDLVDFRPGGEVGSLTIRAGGDLLVNQNLSDGFVKAGSRDDLINSRSWSYRLVAGSDLTSADAEAVTSRTGDLSLSADKMIRTGTGDIRIAAARDLKLLGNGSVIYSAGRATDSTLGESDPRGTLGAFVLRTFPAQYAVDGGDVSIYAANNVVGQVDDQLATGWLHRIGTLKPGQSANFFSTKTAWGVDYSKFRQDIAAFGGGNVSVRAGGGLSDISVVSPSTGKQVGVTKLDNIVEITRGGRIQVETGGDIAGGLFLAGGVGGEIVARGSLKESGTSFKTPLPVRPMLALDGNGKIAVRADGNLDIETVYNPTVIRQTTEQPQVLRNTSYFFTYGAESGVALTSLTGDLRLHNDLARVRQLYEPSLTGDDFAAFIYPPSLSAASLSGDISIDSAFTLYPSGKGRLQLLAANNITNRFVSAPLVDINLSDADPAALPTVENGPDRRFEDTLDKLKSGGRVQDIHAPSPVHAGDGLPAFIVARSGDIRGEVPFHFSSAKSLVVNAGRDIVDTTFYIQNVNNTDVSTIQAGRDILYLNVRDVNGQIILNDSRIEVSGPGRLDLLAGRNVNLGSMAGLLSTGNRNNPGLEDVGADISVLAGLTNTPDYSGFIDKYLTKSSKYDNTLVEYMQGLNEIVNDKQEALVEFIRLPARLQREVLQQVLLTELRDAGTVAAQTQKFADYLPGYEAINTLFPDHVRINGNSVETTDAWQGDIELVFSTIRTLDEGDISLIAPGGSINVGLAVTTGLAKDPTGLGIVVQKLGDVNAVVRDDILVNQSRIFSLDGGDIMLWTSTSDIDAGRGARTAISAPPPIITIDANGNVTTEFPPATAGSGIQAAVSTPGRAPGSGFLFAPVGVVDFSDAGAAFAGDLTVAAARVLNQDSLRVGGISVGVTTTDTGGLSGLNGLSSITAAATKMAEDSASSISDGDEKKLRNRHGILLVELLGLDNRCESGSQECNN